jgi:[acyl-carrier-protein] S-malonyltransferase
LATSVIFPAFVNEYTGTEGQVISAFENNFAGLIAMASDNLKLDLTGFDFTNNNFLHDELKSQYISYLFSCSVADILKVQKIKPSFVSGYSMGIYAALYYCGSITFKEGLMMVKNAWDIISGVTAGGKYGMGIIIGLEEADILHLLHAAREVEICNRNNKHTFIISGLFDAVDTVLLSAKNEGAMRANIIQVSKPYHSQFLRSAGPEFAESIKDFSFRAPDCRYISAMDQQIIKTAEGLKKEVIKNLSSRMNWLDTMSFLLTMGTDVFFECGAGDGLTRNARFVEGNFKSFSVAKLDKFLDIAERE